MTRPLRIAYLFPQFPVPTETFAVSDIAALRDLGHQVQVFTLKPPRKDERDLCRLCLVPTDVPVDRSDWRRMPAWAGFILRRPALHARLGWRLVRNAPRHPRPAAEALLCLPRIAEIAERVSDGGFDVVHAFWSRHVALALPMLEKIDSTVLRSAFAGAYDLVADDMLLAGSIASAEYLFTHAEANRLPLEKRGADPGRLAVIARGIPLADLSVPVERDPYRLMTASALVGSKNVATVLRAFAAVRAEEPRLSLDVFGQGPELSALQRLAKQLGCEGSVVFHGHQPRDVVMAAMRRSAQFLLLSNKPSERLPNVIKEAMWAGCAIISSPSIGIEELIPDPALGSIVDSHDPRPAADAIRHWLGEGRPQSEARRRQARQLIETGFSSLASMARYVEVWTKALAANRVPSPGRPPVHDKPASIAATSC